MNSCPKIKAYPRSEYTPPLSGKRGGQTEEPQRQIVLTVMQTLVYYLLIVRRAKVKDITPDILP